MPLFESVNSVSDQQSKLLADCSLLGRPGNYAAHPLLAGCNLFIFAGRRIGNFNIFAEFHINNV